VIVVWEDATNDVEFDGKPEDAGGTIILHDIGFLIKSTRKSTVLATCKEPDGSTVRWIITIPARMVRQIIPLGEIPVGNA